MSRQVNLDWVVRAANRLGFDVHAEPLELMNKGRVEVQIDFERRVFEDYLRLFRECEEQAGNSSVGLLLGEQVDFSELGAYGHVILYAATVKEFLSLIERYEPLLAQANISRFVPGVSTSRLEYHTVWPAEHPFTYDIDLTLAAYTTAIRSYVGPDWRPVGAGFEYARPKNIDEHRRIFGDRLFFGESVSYVELQNWALNTEIRDIEPELLRIVLAYVDKLIEQTTSPQRISTRVKAILIASIGQENIDQASVASRLHMSRASLQRRLSAEGTGFRYLREEVVYHLARQTLANTSSSIADIALMLGYSETSAFIHAFTRLSDGVTPLQYRRQTAS